MAQVIERVVQWLIFTVVLGLVPLVFGVFRVSTRENTVSLNASIERVLAGGELLLVAAILCGDATGKLVNAGPTLRPLKILASGGAIMLLLFAALYFGEVTAIRLAGGPLDVALVQRTSVHVFLAAVVCSTSCVALAEVP